jgi:hypothetical protein
MRWLICPLALIVGCRCCHKHKEPLKVEHTLKVILDEKSPYNGPPDIKIEGGLKW